MTRVCSDCAAPITKWSSSGRCRRCAALHTVALWTPEQREAARAHGRRMIVNLQRPDVAAKSHSPEARRAATERRRQTMMGWCPDEFLPLYRELRDRKGMGASARAVIEPMIPGTIEHARRVIANNNDASRIRDERRKAQAY